MRTIERILSKLDSYLYTIKRDTKKGWYVLEIGIPASWTYKSNSKVECKELGGNEKSVLVQINPLEDDVSVDSLLEFAVQVVNNNKKIEKMREDFELKMSDIKVKLEEEYETFEDEIENIGDNLFDKEEKDTKTKKVEVKEETE